MTSYVILSLFGKEGKQANKIMTCILKDSAWLINFHGEMLWRDFSSVTEHGVIAFIGHLKTEVDANTLFIWLNYLAFTVVFRTYVFVVLLGCG